MDFGKAFSFVFDDEDWLTKIGVAGLISLIPIVGSVIVVGWGFEVVRRVIKDDPTPLPDWSDFGKYIVNGFLVMVVAFVYALPILIVQGCSVGIVPFLESSDQETVAAIVSIVSICLSCIIGLYSIFLGFVLPAALGNYAAKGEFGAAFKFGTVFGLVRQNLGSYAMVFLGSLLAGVVASLGIIACVIGVLFTSAYAMVVNGHLAGQAYKIATGNGVSQTVEAVPAEDL